VDKVVLRIWNME